MSWETERKKGFWGGGGVVGVGFGGWGFWKAKTKTWENWSLERLAAPERGGGT